MIYYTGVYLIFGLAFGLHYYQNATMGDPSPKLTMFIITIFWLPIIVIVLMDAVADHMSGDDNDFSH